MFSWPCGPLSDLQLNRPRTCMKGKRSVLPLFMSALARLYLQVFLEEGLGLDWGQHACLYEGPSIWMEGPSIPNP